MSKANSSNANRRNRTMAVGAAALVAVTALASCQPTTKVTSPVATTWKAGTTGGSATVEVVSNGSTPAAYLCTNGVDYSPGNGLKVHGDCVAHFDGTGFAVEVPAACIDALVGSWGGPAVGPLTVVVRNDATGAVLASRNDLWNGANPLSTPRFPNQIPRNLYFATSGKGTITSGYRKLVNGPSGLPADDIRVQTVPRVAAASKYRITMTCDVAKGSGVERTTFLAYV